jgi:cytochrome P450
LWCYRYPEILKILREEQQDIQQRFGPELTSAALKEMKYTEAVVREAWRLHPVVPVVGRKANSQGTSLGPFKILPNQPTWVALNYVLKSDPRWEGSDGELHPGVFNPERFLALEGHAQGSQLVFGAGKRSCLGEKLAWTDLKVMLAVIGRGYEFEVAPGAEVGGFPFPSAHMHCSRFAPIA